MRIGTYQRLAVAAEEIVKKFESDNMQKCRVSTRLWKHILLNNMDSIRICGSDVKLTGRSLGAGVWELSLEIETSNS